MKKSISLLILTVLFSSLSFGQSLADPGKLITTINWVEKYGVVYKVYTLSEQVSHLNDLMENDVKRGNLHATRGKAHAVYQLIQNDIDEFEVLYPKWRAYKKATPGSRKYNIYQIGSHLDFIKIYAAKVAGIKIKVIKKK